MSNEIKKRWAKNLSEEEQFELLLARSERDRAKAREYQRKNKVKTAAKKYNIEESELQAIIDEAGGICKICQGELGDRLNIDHCHNSLKVRGVLCSSCNTGLGLFKDNIDSMYRAIEYLKNPR